MASSSLVIATQRSRLSLCSWDMDINLLAIFLAAWSFIEAWVRPLPLASCTRPYGIVLTLWPLTLLCRVAAVETYMIIAKYYNRKTNTKLSKAQLITLFKVCIYVQCKWVIPAHRYSSHQVLHYCTLNHSSNPHQVHSNWSIYVPLPIPDQCPMSSSR